MHQLEGKTAIVTGAASGVGLGLARTFARHGMSVVLCDLRGDMEQKEWLMTRHQHIIDAYDACARWIAERADMAPGHAG